MTASLFSIARSTTILLLRHGADDDALLSHRHTYDENFLIDDLLLANSCLQLISFVVTVSMNVYPAYFCTISSTVRRRLDLAFHDTDEVYLTFTAPVMMHM